MISGLLRSASGSTSSTRCSPYLLELWGDPEAYGIAGLVAAVVAGAPDRRRHDHPAHPRRFARRTSALMFLSALGLVPLTLIGLIANFWVVVVLIVLWGLADAAASRSGGRT